MSGGDELARANARVVELEARLKAESERCAARRLNRARSGTRAAGLAARLCLRKPGRLGRCRLDERSLEPGQLMLQQPEPSDFVIATGRTTSVRSFVEAVSGALYLT